MSYSRFGDSEWYTYWSTPLEGVVENCDTMAFEICMVTRFMAKELRDDIDACLAQVLAIVTEMKREKTYPYGAWQGESDLEELRGYMLEFLADVDEHYPVTNERPGT